MLPNDAIGKCSGAGGVRTGRNVAAQLSGIAEVPSGDVNYGERVILANGGAVKRMPQNPGVAESSPSTKAPLVQVMLLF